MKTVVICGSRRFEKGIREFATSLKEAGITVYEPYLHQSKKEEWEALSEQYKKYIALGLTHDHFYKIKIADVVFVYNQDGYSGNSTTLEIGYAVASGKPIFALSNSDEELCRNVLFKGFCKSAKDFVDVLK